MTATATVAGRTREPELAGQTVVVIGGSAGIGLETARRARAEGADVIITGRDPERLSQAVRLVEPQRAAAFDVSDLAALENFFRQLGGPIDHVMVTAAAPTTPPWRTWTSTRRAVMSMATSGRCSASPATPPL